MEYLTDALFMCDLFVDTADAKSVTNLVVAREHIATVEVHVVRAGGAALRR